MIQASSDSCMVLMQMDKSAVQSRQRMVLGVMQLQSFSGDDRASWTSNVSDGGKALTHCCDSNEKAGGRWDAFKIIVREMPGGGVCSLVGTLNGCE